MVLFCSLPSDLYFLRAWCDDHFASLAFPSPVFAGGPMNEEGFCVFAEQLAANVRQRGREFGNF